MGIALDRSQDASLLRLEGVIDISVAAELKAALIEALQSGNAVRIAAASVTDLDVTAYQLLWAARQQARQAGAAFTLDAEIPEPVRMTLAEMGFNSGALQQ